MIKLAFVHNDEIYREGLRDLYEILTQLKYEILHINLNPRKLLSENNLEIIREKFPDRISRDFIKHFNTKIVPDVFAMLDNISRNIKNIAKTHISNASGMIPDVSGIVYDYLGMKKLSRKSHTRSISTLRKSRSKKGRKSR